MLGTLEGQGGKVSEEEGVGGEDTEGVTVSPGGLWLHPGGWSFFRADMAWIGVL